MIDKMIGHFEEKNRNRCFVLDDVEENKEVSKKHEDVWGKIKKESGTINGGKNIEYGKDLKKLGSSLMMIYQWINL